MKLTRTGLILFLCLIFAQLFSLTAAAQSSPPPHLPRVTGDEK